MPVFSVIIPVFNTAPYLHECLDSMFAQTDHDWECVCVDDGSTDGSGAILDEYTAKDARFRVIHQANAGVSAARNAALDAIRGDFFTFVDADDAIAPDSLECFAAAFRETAADGLICHPYDDWIQAGEPLGSTPGFRLLARSVRPPELLAGCFAANGYAPSRIYRTSVFGRIRFPIGISVAEDVRYWADALCIPASWAVIRKRYYLYRTGRTGAASKGPSVRKCHEDIRALAYVAKRMRNGMNASRADLRAYVKRFGSGYVSYLHKVFLRWSGLSGEERRETMLAVEECRTACGFWPFRWTDRIRVATWRRHADGPLFRFLLFIDRARYSFVWRKKRFFSFFDKKGLHT